jgi:hypothetical protein
MSSRMKLAIVQDRPLFIPASYLPIFDDTVNSPLNSLKYAKGPLLTIVGTCSCYTCMELMICFKNYPLLP